ncbi:MAG: glycosyltransferase family 2 protein [Ornithinimicrobium sp.]
MSAVRDVVVAIPARNEEDLLSTCLSSVRAALATLVTLHPDVRTAVVVALDGCTDGSAEVARRAGAHIVELIGAGVGASRDAAAHHGLGCLGGPQDALTWLACTDADTVVPPNWLVRQLIWADSGMDMVLGTVEPVGVRDPAALAAWHSRHRLGEGHPYVHGANLGVRVSTWRSVGGFGPRRAHEDVALAARVRSSAVSWVATDTTRAQTSGRLVGRAPSGFAEYLNALSSPQ